MSVLLFLLCACSATLAVPTAEYYELEEAELHFEHFIQEHNKVYADEEEKQYRFQIFKENLEHANRMNEKSSHAEFGITKFMDLSNEEFLDMYTGLSLDVKDTLGDCTLLSDKDVPEVEAPESFDWREHNAVTPVKNQRSCGSCFAFSATGHLEGQYAIKHKQLIELSEQQIVDCDRASNGCNGGLMTLAFSSIMKLGGIQNEASYPYIGHARRCQYNARQAVLRIHSCNAYNLRSQESLKRLVYSYGPVSIAVKAKGFHTYKGGIIAEDACDVGDVNHAVLIVGYGTEKGHPYWIVKNSWDTSFGEQGYIKVHRGDNYHSCGLMNTYMATAKIL